MKQELVGLGVHHFNLDFVATSRHIKPALFLEFGDESDAAPRKIKCSAEDGSSP